MSPLPSKKKSTQPKRSEQMPTRQRKPALASQLRAQTRKVLAKHYRAKHGVR